jgi:hypothetical protein
MEIEIPALGQSATDPTFETTIQLDYTLQLDDKLYATTEKANSFDVIAEGLDFAYYASSVRPESTNYKAAKGLGYISAANPGLDGSGTIANPIVTAGASGSGWKGLCIDSIFIKAEETVTFGMVRIFIQNTGTGTSDTFLFKEIFVPDNIPSGTSMSFGHNIVFPNKLQLEPGFKILATTENNDGFTVLANAMDWKYPA